MIMMMMVMMDDDDDDGDDDDEEEEEWIQKKFVFSWFDQLSGFRLQAPIGPSSLISQTLGAKRVSHTLADPLYGAKAFVLVYKVC